MELQTKLTRVQNHVMWLLYKTHETAQSVYNLPHMLKIMPFLNEKPICVRWTPSCILTTAERQRESESAVSGTLKLNIGNWILSGTGQSPYVVSAILEYRPRF